MREKVNINNTHPLIYRLMKYDKNNLDKLNKKINNLNKSVHKRHKQWKLKGYKCPFNCAYCIKEQNEKK